MGVIQAAGTGIAWQGMNGCNADYVVLQNAKSGGFNIQILSYVMSWPQMDTTWCCACIMGEPSGK